MLKNEAVANHMLSRWFCMVDENLIVLSQVHNSIHLDKITDITGPKIYKEMMMAQDVCTAL